MEFLQPDVSSGAQVNLGASLIFPTGVWWLLGGGWMLTGGVREVLPSTDRDLDLVLIFVRCSSVVVVVSQERRGEEAGSV